MDLFQRMQAKRRTAKLRDAKQMDAAALSELQNALVQMGAPVIPPVLECLGHGDARGPAMEVLGRLLNNDTLPMFLAALVSPNPAVSSGVTRVLASSRHYDPTRVLVLLAQDQPSKSAIEGILRDQAAVISPARILQLFPKLEKDGQAVVFRLLEKTENDSVLHDLIRLLANEDWWVRMSVVRLLTAHPKDMVVREIAGRVADENRTVRLEAINALVRMQAKDAVPDVIAALRDPDYMVQSAAVDFLMANAPPSTVPSLLEVLTDESEYARRAAVEVLNQVATPEAIQDLVRALRDEDWWVRVRAADALGTLGGEKVVLSVVGLLTDPDDMIRRHAIEILNAVADERAVEPLIGALEDSDWWVRERAIDALGRTRDPRVVEPLLRLLAQEEHVVPLCVRALGSIRDVRALPAICDLTDTDREDVRREVIEALKLFLRTSLEAKDVEAVHQALARLHVSSAENTVTPLSVHRGSTPRPAQPLTGGTLLTPLSQVAPVPAVKRIPTPSAIGPRPKGPNPAAPSPASTPTPTTPAPMVASHAATKPTPKSPNPGSMLDVNQLPPGLTILDRYKVLRRVGHGGFGAVYLVEDAAIQEEVILKFLNPQLAFDQDSRRRFVQELKLTRRITHRSVIRLFDFIEDGPIRAVSMEYFPGEDLGRLLTREKRLDPRRVLHIAMQVCDGLIAAHEVGVVHRDLKPPNILIGEGDTVKIVDFGLAATQQQTGSRITKSGLLIGSPEYMAPEQISGEATDARADIYSLGIVMYEAISGSKPYTDETPVKVLFRHLEGGAKPLGSITPGIPAGLEALVSRAMSREAANRPANAEALRRLIEGQLMSLEEAA